MGSRPGSYFSFICLKTGFIVNRHPLTEFTNKVISVRADFYLMIEVDNGYVEVVTGVTCLREKFIQIHVNRIVINAEVLVSDTSIIEPSQEALGVTAGITAEYVNIRATLAHLVNFVNLARVGVRARQRD